MKAILFLLLTTCTMGIRAQVTLVEADFPVAAQSYVVSQTSDIASSDYQLTGTSYTWDFSTLTPTSQDTVLFEGPASSTIPFTYIFTFNNPADQDHKATVATGQDFGSPVPGLTFTDAYLFYKLSSSNWIQVGMGVTINGAPIPVKMDPTDNIFVLPVAYGDQDTSYSFFEMDIPTIGYYAEGKTRQNDVDGWGTVTTPFGTFSALRVKTDLLIHDSIYYDAYSMGFGTDRTETEYKWFADGFSIPVIQITERTGMGSGSTIRYIDSLRNIGINEYPEIEKASIWPNPASDICRIVVPALLDQNASMTIFDAMGRLILQKEVEFNRTNFVTINVSDFPTGVYNVNIRSSERYFSARLVVQ